MKTLHYFFLSLRMRGVSQRAAWKNNCLNQDFRDCGIFLIE